MYRATLLHELMSTCAAGCSKMSCQLDSIQKPLKYDVITHTPHNMLVFIHKPDIEKPYPGINGPCSYK